MITLHDTTADPADPGDTGLSLAEHASALLEGLGIGTDSPPTKGTGRRLATAMRNLTYGLHLNPGRYLQTLTHHTPDGPGTPSTYVAVRAIPVRGLCTCHALPYTGAVDVAHLPSENGALYLHARQITRFTQAHAARPTNAELLACCVAQGLDARLGENSAGVAVRAVLRPSCALLHDIGPDTAAAAFYTTRALTGPAHHAAILTTWSTQ
ncbi:hypothetical protein GCM10017673_38630 [Streptosporangium violaceochromogenes]|nr:hypothetical protein GCM10017673_38630 [Streptosporangium violaceochromogenes]